MAHKKGKGMTGKQHSKITKKKISKANTGKIRTDLCKANHSKRMSGKGNSMYGKVHPCKGTKRNNKQIDIQKVIELINDEYSTKQITEKTGFSDYLIYKHLNNYPLFFKKLKQINIHVRKGQCNYWLKGKSYEEIFKSKEKANQRAKITSEWMKTEKNIRRFCKHPSKPQIDLYKLIKIKYEYAMLEYPIKINKNKTIWLDIALVKDKINIEYDGEYWHNLNGIDKDKERDIILKNKGWKVIRIKSNNKNIMRTLVQGGLKF